MSDSPTVLAICGSLREQSHTRTACCAALDAAATAGAETDLMDLRAYDLPVFDADQADAGDAPRLRSRLREADAIVLASPMYHGSYSSALKNALDYCGFDEFEGTTVGLLGVSGGSFPITTLEHLRSVARALDAWVIPHQAAVPNAADRFAEGEFVDETVAERVRTLGRRAVQYANIEPDPYSFESEENVGAED
ncbi:MAG: NAD(P)H-dependent oxidoreductase [Haloarculaceae archaeon]